MQTPNFGPSQYVDQNVFNGAFQTVSSGLYTENTGLFFTPGLINPDLVSVGATGLTLQLTFPTNFALVDASGVYSTAHGTTTGQDTQTYSLNLTSLVPSAGSTQIFIALQTYPILQNPVPVPGPPVGHPNYNPNFVPYINYNKTIDSFSVTSSIYAPVNTAIFEFARFNLPAGATNVPTLNTEYQQRAAVLGNQPFGQVAYNNTMTSANMNLVNSIIVGGSTQTLPAASKYTGARIGFFNGNTIDCFISTTSPDLFYGVYYSTNGLGINSYNIRSGELVWFSSNGTSWIVSAGNANPIVATYAGSPVGVVPGRAASDSTPPDLVYDSVNKTVWAGQGSTNWLPIVGSTGGAQYTAPGTYVTYVPTGAFILFMKLWGGGGGGGGSTGTGSPGASGTIGGGGGGGGGGYVENCVPVMPGQQIVLTVGAGGAPGGYGSAGGNGGTTSVNVNGLTYFATPGNGGGGGNGNTPGTGGAGGSSSGGATNQIVKSGLTGGNYIGTSVVGLVFQAQGGGSPNGPGGLGPIASVVLGGQAVNGEYPGAGGNGGLYNSLGGAGAAGEVDLIFG
jgi:hypothetical protein